MIRVKCKKMKLYFSVFLLQYFGKSDISHRIELSLVTDEDTRVG